MSVANQPQPNYPRVAFGDVVRLNTDLDMNRQ